MIWIWVYVARNKIVVLFRNKHINRQEVKQPNRRIVR